MEHQGNQRSAGARFRAAVAEEMPLQIVGAINAYTARMAEASGFRARYTLGTGPGPSQGGHEDYPAH